MRVERGASQVLFGMLPGQGEDGADGNLGDLTQPLHELGIAGRSDRDGHDAVYQVKADRAGFARDLDWDPLNGFVSDDVSHAERVGP